MLSHEQIARALEDSRGSIAAAARSLGVPRRTLSDRVNGDAELALAREQARAGRPVNASGSKAWPVGVEVKGDDASFTSEGRPKLGTLEDLMRENGLDPDEWVIISHTINRWQALAHGGGADGEPRIVTLRQVKATLRRKVALQLEILSPASHVPALVKRRKPTRVKGEPDRIVVEGDHQVPYHDPALDAAATEFVREWQPTEHVFYGDGADFPTISRHNDHPAATATPQECVNGYYSLLRRRAEAAPNARRVKLKGNHDWRIESEQLTRAERIYGVAPAFEEVEALSLKRLLHLDRLEVELVEHPLGWEHAEVELVPGPNGLVVRHGFVTGNNTGRRTADKLGRSAIVGHDHGKEHHWKRLYPGGTRLRQAVVAGTMSRCDDVFPHYAINPDWHQGFVTVLRWPDGRFHIEHATFEEGVLFWRDRRYGA